MVKRRKLDTSARDESNRAPISTVAFLCLPGRAECAGSVVPARAGIDHHGGTWCINRASGEYRRQSRHKEQTNFHTAPWLIKTLGIIPENISNARYIQRRTVTLSISGQ